MASQSPDFDDTCRKSNCGTRRVHLWPPRGPGRPKLNRKSPQQVWEILGFSMSFPHCFSNPMLFGQGETHLEPTGAAATLETPQLAPTNFPTPWAGACAHCHAPQICLARASRDGKNEDGAENGQGGNTSVKRPGRETARGKQMATHCIFQKRKMATKWLPRARISTIIAEHRTAGRGASIYGHPGARGGPN